MTDPVAANSGDHNQLNKSSSPYLLQHKDNPVHWWMWGEAALAAAQSQNKPILLSVGYAACHWCHVMAHESFENEATAALMNELYINIKVDREERPDIDAIYMEALHCLGEQGGWPLTMFLTPDGLPFWGGTYFPPRAGFGRPGFPEVLREVSTIFHTQPEKVSHNASLLKNVLEHGRPKQQNEAQHQKEAQERDETPRSAPHSLSPTGSNQDEPSLPALSLLKLQAERLTRLMDMEQGGINGAPKFPQPTLLGFLWRAGVQFDLPNAKHAVAASLTHMCQGGIYDHLGGGFARYSVDDRWLVPHFEKMLYDNALLIDMMCDVSRESAPSQEYQDQKALYKQRIAETIDWALREMKTGEISPAQAQQAQSAIGFAFSSSLDADQEGVEGKFYVWSYQEICALLGREDAEFFAAYYNISEEGNWHDPHEAQSGSDAKSAGKNVLNRLLTMDAGPGDDEIRLKTLRQKLFEARTARTAPGLDDKILTDWNGLFIHALAKAGNLFDQAEWIETAKTSFAFIETHLNQAQGSDQALETTQNEPRLAHSMRKGQISAPGMASDYANMIMAALTLYQITHEADYLTRAENWADMMARHFWDRAKGGYFFNAADTKDVIVRRKTATDDATPNANGVMAANLLKLSALSQNTKHAQTYRAMAEAIFMTFADDIATNPFSLTSTMSAMMAYYSPLHIVIAHSETPYGQALVETLRQHALPDAIEHILKGDTQGHEQSHAQNLPAALSHIHNQKTSAAYICAGPQCSAPIDDPAEFADALKKARQLQHG